VQTHPSLGLPRARRRASLRTFAVAIASLLCASAVAQYAEARRSFSIPAQAAEPALKIFAEQSGSGVIMNARTVEGFGTNPVRGTFTPPEALQHLLAGTGLKATADERSGAFVVHRPEPDPPNTLPPGDRARKSETPNQPNLEPMKINRLLARVFASFAAVASVFAQSTNPSTGSPSSTSAKGDSVVQLSPFEVTSNTDVGYQATDTMAGSRMNTALKDIAASISVFTEEFMKDINATDLIEVMAYGNNFQPDLDDAGGFGDNSAGNSIMGRAVGAVRVRGLPADVSRNYFKWQNSTDTYNVGRVEDARGPNSVLFGIGNAGGIINVATKQAVLKRPMREISLSGGSFSSWRATLDVNQPLGDKVAVRFNAVANRSRYFQAYRFSESRRAHLAAKYEITPWLTAKIEYEKGEVEANSGRLTGVFDGVVPWLNAGRPLFSRTAPNSDFTGLGTRVSTNLSTLRFVSNSNQLIHLGGQIATLGSRGAGSGGYPITDPSIISYSINRGGPGQIRTNPYDSISAIATFQLGKKTFAELGVNRQSRHFDSVDPVLSHILYADPNTHLPGVLGVNPYAGRLYMETYWRKWDAGLKADTARLSFSHEINAGKWGRYRGGVFGEFEKEDGRSNPKFEVFDGNPFNAAADQNLAYRRTYVTEGAWGSYYVNSPTQTGLLNNVTDPVSGRAFSTKWVVYNASSNDTSEAASGTASLQGHWFNGRLIVGAGYRMDRHAVDDYGQVRDPVTGDFIRADTFTRPISEPQTRTFSVVWHALKNVSFKYNQATNSSAVNSGVRVFPSKPAGPVFTGPASKGFGRDYGVTVTLLNGKLYASLVRYATESVGELFSGAGTHNKQNERIRAALLSNGLITIAEADDRASNANATSRDKSAEGYELSLIANPGEWRLSVNGSYTDGAFSKIIPEVVEWWAGQKAFYSRFPQNIQTGVGANTIADEIATEDDSLAETLSDEGVGLVGNAKYKANFFARYSFNQGFLKGAFAGGGYTYTGKTLVGRTLGADRRLQFAPPVGQASLLLGYERRLSDRVRLSTQLNVSNLFDETDPRIIRYANTGDTYEIRRFAVRDPRMWTPSTRLSI